MIAMAVFFSPISFFIVEIAATHGLEKITKIRYAQAVGKVKKENVEEEKIFAVVPARIDIDETTSSFATKPSITEMVAAQLSVPITG